MRDRLSFIFGVVTIGVLTAALAFSIRTMVSYRDDGRDRGKQVYSEFSQEWNRHFATDTLQSMEGKTGSDQSLTWFFSFIEQHPRVKEVSVVTSSDTQVFYWDSGTGHSEVSQIVLTDRRVRFGDQLLHVHMRYRVISRSSYFDLFRGIGYITAGYAAFLLILFPVSFVRTRRCTDESAASEKKHRYSDGADSGDSTHGTAAEDATEADEFIPSTATWEIHTRLRTELDLASQQEKDLCLILLQLFPVEDVEPNEWLQQRFIFQDLIFAREEQHYAVILPDADIHIGLREARSAVDHWPEIAYAGVTSRGGRLLDVNRLMHEAYTALNRARGTQEKVVGFQTDPDKYRRFIARSLDPDLEK